MSDNKLLVIENRGKYQNSIVYNLKQSNFDVMEVQQGNLVINMIKEANPSLVVLELKLPGADGFKLCAQLKARYPTLPLIIVSSWGHNLDIVTALEMGADDFIIKPFNPLELLVRIHSVLKRASKRKKLQISDQISAGPFILESKKRRVYKNGKLIYLTEIECKLMKQFMQRINEPISKDILLDEIWGMHEGNDFRTLAVHVRRLREKIEEFPSNPEFLKTIWSFGYCFHVNENE
ncbi:response regulator transcription factor [Cytobacillus sp. FJAT-53684]|uniref:Response regulator transcription factor n=1 Tax=Cytobacillus mangrovibacter TaxID=3299024 RepID=A0ABW6K0M5_9BACI